MRNIKSFSPTLTASTSTQMDRSRPLGHQGLALVTVQVGPRFDIQLGLCNPAKQSCISNQKGNVSE
jgi:hypothetical protein